MTRLGKAGTATHAQLTAARRRMGFTLIELLVVMAIIAILAALIFPIFRTAQEGARKSTCQENLHQIYEAVKLYRLDNNAFPPDIWAPAAPAAGLKALFPTYLKSLASLHCPNGLITDPTKFSTTTTVMYDTYDGPDEYALAQNLPAPANTVRKYALQRAPAANNEEQLGRQLALLYPASGTVITWCTQHRPRSVNIPTPQPSSLDDLFLFEDGSVRRMAYAGFNTAPCDTVSGFKSPSCL